MATIIRPVVMEFRLDTTKTFIATRHYDLIKGDTLFSEKLNISKDRKCARSSPHYWLKKRLKNKWSKWLTGLFPTSFEGWYYGDLENKRHLVIFHLEGSKLRLFHFTNFYTSKVNDLIKTIQEKY